VTAFKRILQLDKAASVVDVSFDQEGVIVTPRIAWDSVGDIIARVVADHLTEARFHGLVLINVRRGLTHRIRPDPVRPS
jgi:hypothetical protein